MASTPPDPHIRDPLHAQLDRALRGVTFVPPASTWQRVLRGLRGDLPDPGRALRVTGVILLSLLILGALVYAFNRVLTSLLSGPV